MESKVEITQNDGKSKTIIKTNKPFVIAPLRRRKKKGDFFMGHQPIFEILAKDKELTGADHRVLLYMFSICDFENWVRVTLQYIADELDMRRPNVSRSVSKLKKEGYLRSVKMGGSNVYQIHPDVIIKGNEDERRKVIKMFEDA